MNKQRKSGRADDSYVVTPTAAIIFKQPWRLFKFAKRLGCFFSYFPTSFQMTGNKATNEPIALTELILLS